MADLIKALVLFTFGFAILANLGDALEKSSAKTGVNITASVLPGSAQPPMYDGQVEAFTHVVEKPLTVQERVVRNGSYAQVCSTYDPVAHPEQVLDILEYASQASGTPVDAIYAVWRNETGFLYGSGTSDNCPVGEQLKIRCKVGGSCQHLEAMEEMSRRFSWDLGSMRCSCGSATMDDNTHYFGGCCGPFQFSGAEIKSYALDYDLDPMKFCGGAVIAALELRGHHDRYVKDGYDDSTAWRKAVSRYFGSDSKGKYWAHAKANWSQFHSWYGIGKDEIRKKLTAQAVWNVSYLRKHGVTEAFE